MTSALVQQLDYQGEVSDILRAAGYHSREFGLMSRADLDRMETARDGGQTPAEFAASVLAVAGEK